MAQPTSSERQHLSQCTDRIDQTTQEGARADRLKNMPTRLVLPKADIDEAIAAGRDATREATAGNATLPEWAGSTTGQCVMAPAVAMKLPSAAIVDDGTQGPGLTLKQRWPAAAKLRRCRVTLHTRRAGCTFVRARQVPADTAQWLGTPQGGARLAARRHDP